MHDLTVKEQGSHILLNIRRFSHQDSTDSISSIMFQQIEFRGSMLSRTNDEIPVSVIQP